MKMIFFEFLSKVQHRTIFDHHDLLGGFFFEMLGLVAIIATVVASAVAIALLKYLNRIRQ